MKKLFLPLAITCVLLSTFAILLIIWLISIYTFTPFIQNTYQGYIYFKNSPIISAKIVEENTNNLNYTFSDKKGYFKLKKIDPDRINNIIIYHNANIDTIQILRIGAAGSSNRYIFLQENRVDTLDINLERQHSSMSNYSHSSSD